MKKSEIYAYDPWTELDFHPLVFLLIKRTVGEEDLRLKVKKLQQSFDARKGGS